jgi:hypothetical protein
MKYLLKKKTRQDFLSDNWKLETLIFRWGKSGMRPVRIYDKRNDKTEFGAGGYGYDKQGTAFGRLIAHYFGNELKRLDSSEFYGVRHYNYKNLKSQRRASKHTITSIDGACGFSSMERILNKIGFGLEFITETKHEIIYKLNIK